jgi:hypothetical protein
MTPRDPRVQAAADELIAAAGGSEKLDNMTWEDGRRDIIFEIEENVSIRAGCSFHVARGAVAMALRKSRDKERLKREGNS